MLNIQYALLTPGAERGRTGKALKAEGVLIHYTGNPGSSATANRNYFENGSGGNKVSSHYIVGLSGEIIQCVPENERAAHAGKSYSPIYKEIAKTNNSRYIGIETCHPGADGKFSKTTFRSLTSLTADICRRNNFSPFLHIKRHYDVTGKACPLYYVKFPEEWEKLQGAIYAALLSSLCIKHNRQIDMPYWERVISGEISADPKYIRILEERLSDTAYIPK